MPSPSTPTKPELAVIIPHYNDLTRLTACLEALKPQALAVGSRVDVVVVDNDSPVDMRNLAKLHPWTRVVVEPQKGAAAARNRGVAVTDAPYLVFLDSDCVPMAGWLDCALRIKGTVDVIGGRVDTFDETPAPRSGAEAFETVFAFHQRNYIEAKGFSVTANLLTSRAVFKATGPMVVGLSEDVDWCKRATSRGFALVYSQELAVAHPTRQDWAALEKKWKRTTVEGFHLNGTSPAGRIKWAARAVFVLLSGPAHLLRIVRSPKLARPVEKWRGAVTLLRLRAARALWMVGQSLKGD